MQLQANSSIIHQLSWQTSLHSAHKTWMSLSWVNDRVGGPCQPGAWTRALPTLQFTPSGQRGRGERRKDEVDDRRNEAVTQMSAKTKGQPGKCYQTDLTTERGALSMTFLWEMKLKKNKIKEHCFSIQYMVPHIMCQSEWYSFFFYSSYAAKQTLH